MWHVNMLIESGGCLLILYCYGGIAKLLWLNIYNLLKNQKHCFCDKSTLALDIKYVGTFNIAYEILLTLNG